MAFASFALSINHKTVQIQIYTSGCLCELRRREVESDGRLGKSGAVGFTLSALLSQAASNAAGGGGGVAGGAQRPSSAAIGPRVAAPWVWSIYDTGGDGGKEAMAGLIGGQGCVDEAGGVGRRRGRRGGGAAIAR
jgi:hypothetical protein